GTGRAPVSVGLPCVYSVRRGNQVRETETIVAGSPGARSRPHAYRCAVPRSHRPGRSATVRYLPTSTPFIPVELPRDLIERKRRGEVLSPDEWSGLASAYLRGEVPDYQMAALLMAVVWRGMDREETGALTRTMLQSGARFDLSHIGRPRVDKHSTGG